MDAKRLNPAYLPFVRRARVPAGSKASCGLTFLELESLEQLGEGELEPVGDRLENS